MRVVLGGVTGFIGTALVRALLGRGDAVTVLGRSTDRIRQAFGTSVEAREWHPPALGPWTDALHGADAVVNLAGLPVVEPLKPWTAAQKARIRGSRVDSTRALAAAIQASDLRPEIFVSQSAIGYYGDGGDTILTERSTAGTDFMASVCADWEAAARPVEEAGVRLAVLRTAIVLGNGGQIALLTLPYKMLFGGTLGRRGQWFSWIHLDDEVGLILHAIDHNDARGPINATAPNPVTIDTFSRSLGAALHRPTWFPLYPLLFRIGLGQRSQALLASQRVVPERARELSYAFKYSNIDQALASIFK